MLQKLPMNSTKIIATIGPKSSNINIIKKLVLAGADIFRVNFSHTDYETAYEIIQNIRKIEDEFNKPIPIIQDLQGPKIRLNSFNLPEEQATLIEGATFVINIPDDIETEDETYIYIKYKDIYKELKEKDRILIDDGNIELVVLSIDKNKILTEVLRGGVLKQRKGVNLPDTNLSIPALTEKDIKDAKFGIENNVDYMALSFVRTASDVMELKKLIKENNAKISVIAKIEKPEALNNIEEIYDAVDVVLVARGDLGVECDLAKVPSLQKKLIELGKIKKTPVIIATQMLESMIKNSSPTRAEVTDVYQAVKDGADIVMLSAETAIGDFPVETIKMMERIIKIAEKDIVDNKYKIKMSMDTESAIAIAGAGITDQIAANFICVFTETGRSARIVSKTGMKKPILAFAPDKKMMRKVALYRGVIPIETILFENINILFESAGKTLLESGMCKKGDKVVIVAGQPLGKAGTTNLLKVHTV